MIEAILAIAMYITCLFILPALMHKALYIFAKVTYKIHKTRINAKQYERFMKAWRKVYAEI